MSKFVFNVKFNAEHDDVASFSIDSQLQPFIDDHF